MNIAGIPRRGYVKNRTPIEALPNFSKALGGDVEIFIKRDDQLPGAGGGSKTRKLDYEIESAIRAGADSVITWGALQSNHCRLTLDWANREGLGCHLLLEERIPESYKRRASTNNFLYFLLGVSSTSVFPFGTDMAAAAESKLAELRAKGGRPYIIEIGASTALGSIGYSACAVEMINQLQQMRKSVGHVVIASGSGGSQAGLITGFESMSTGIAVHGISVGRPKSDQEDLVYKIVNGCSEILKLSRPIRSEAVVCYDNYVGPGYSQPTDEMVEAVTLLARTEGILLDPVYTGKAMAGLIGLVRNRTIAKGSAALFMHTGGSLSLFDKTEHFWNHIDKAG